ncbi:MAG: autotransporter outer membrane beta-barrel domain-containing protein [Gammaproteobacteria bacterium]
MSACIDQQICQSASAAKLHLRANLKDYGLLPLRVKLLILLLLYAGLVEAEWAGALIEIANYDADWKFDNDVREARITSISFQLEEKFETGLRAGGGFGYFDMRLDGNDGDAEDFDGQYLQLYLRQPWSINETVSLYGLFDYRYNSGDSRGGGERADIDWNEVSLHIGARLRFSDYRITPFVAYFHIDGDTSGDGGSGDFENDDSATQGIKFDFIIEDTGFIRLEARTGYQSGGFLSFGRRY